MNNHPSKSRLRMRVMRQREAGMALVVVMLLLIMVSAIGLGMIYMANTESAVNANYRDSQLAFYAMRAGLEEARDRIRSNSPWPIAVPTTMPPAANSIVYIINPAGNGDPVDPATSSNAYFDDEFCHEAFVGDGLVSSGANVPCPSTSGPPVHTYINSISPNTNTASALKFKWARITLKQNGTFANGNQNAWVDGSAAAVAAGTTAATQVCYQGLYGQEIPLTLVPGGPWASCAAAQQAGVAASPVYVITTMAVTPLGSRRIGQYEIGSVTAYVPPLALGMDGPAATYNPAPNSNVYMISGTDSAVTGVNVKGNPVPAVPGCTGTGQTVPAITDGDQQGVTNMFGNPPSSCSGSIPSNRCNNYTGAGGTPSVANGGATGTGTFNGEWSSPTQLDNMIAALANTADVTYSCGIGAPCSPSGPVGTDATPQITYVNGDFNYGNASGAGILIVTGTLFFNGNATFDGLILVVGQGAMSESGGGNGGFNGSVFVAKTHSSTSPYPELATLGTPTIAWNGGGTSFVQYNSCWANGGQGMRYYPIATREEMY